MAIVKSALYSSIWASCDELRCGMDASQYKDYVLFMLFTKYMTDKCGNSGDFAPPVTIPKGASFKDMIALKGKSDIGDKIKTQIIQPLIDANGRLARSDVPDFNDPSRLGQGQAMVNRRTNLIGIFQKPELDCSQSYAVLSRRRPRASRLPGPTRSRSWDRSASSEQDCRLWRGRRCAASWNARVIRCWEGAA